MGHRYVESDENEKLFFIDAANLYVWALSQSLPYDEIRNDKNVKLKDKLNTPDDSDIRQIIEFNIFKFNLKII